MFKLSYRTTRYLISYCNPNLPFNETSKFNRIDNLLLRRNYNIILDVITRMFD